MHQLARLCNSDRLKKGVCSFHDSNRALLQAALQGAVSEALCSSHSATATAQLCQLFDLNSLRRTYPVHEQKTSGPFSLVILSSMVSWFSICYHQKHCLQPLSSGGHYLRTRGKTKGEVQDTTLFQTAKNACHRPQMSALVRQEGTLQTKQQMNLDSFLPTILRNSHSQHESSSSRFKHKPLISLGL